MDLKSEFLFEYLKKHIAEEGSLIVKKIKAIFHFYVSKYAGTAPTCFTINLKEGNGKIKGSVSKGKEGKADASIIIADSDLCDLAAGKLKATKAILNGKLKIKGNYLAALKVTPEMIPLFPKL